MKHIMIFCIPAHGHHNPTFPVTAQLVRRGNIVKYFSFEEFREKIEQTGAEFIPCDSFLPELTKEQETAIKNVSTTEMTIVDLRTTAKMDAFLAKQVAEFSPDVIFCDSVCFWGKLTARKYKIPLVVSTTTFAFNKYSSQYMKSSFAEIKDLIGGFGRIKAELKKLEEYGYHEKSILPLVQNDNFTDSVVYATPKYQPCSETFSAHYAFVGPSVFSDLLPQKKKERPLVYISLGTVINDRPDFYRHCIEALKDLELDVLISCGKYTDMQEFENLPKNITAKPCVDQLEVLSRADVFLTHCGMNSVSESLYMATPMLLFPQTNEQRAVARRAGELGAGLLLTQDDAQTIRRSIQTLLSDKTYAEKASQCSRDFREAPGAEGAARFIESAPHLMPQEDQKSVKREALPGILQLLFWIVSIALILLLPKLTSIKHIGWIAVIAANILFIPFKKFSVAIASKLYSCG